MSNIVELSHATGFKYRVVKQYEPIDDGSYIVISHGRRGRDGRDTYAIAVMIGPDGGEPFGIIAEYEDFDENVYKTVERIARIADKTLSTYILCSPDDFYQKMVGSLAIETEALRHRRRCAQDNLNSVWHPLNPGEEPDAALAAAIKEFSDAKAEEETAEVALRALICRHNFEISFEKRVEAGLEPPLMLASESPDLQRFIDTHEFFARVFPHPTINVAVSA